MIEFCKGCLHVTRDLLPTVQYRSPADMMSMNTSKPMVPGSFPVVQVFGIYSMVPAETRNQQLCKTYRRKSLGFHRLTTAENSKLTNKVHSSQKGTRSVKRRIHNLTGGNSASHSVFVAPSTTPTTLYRLEKKVIQSFKTPFSLSSRSCHSGSASSGLVEVFPRALEASLPANTRRG